MERDLRAVVRPVSKDVFLTLLSVSSNFATLILHAAVMQREASTWVDFISSRGLHFPLYILIRCIPCIRCTLFVYMYGWIGYMQELRLAVVPCRCISVYPLFLGLLRRDVCIYYHDVGRLYVAYPHLWAMLRPDLRDKHGGTYSHVFFVSIICVDCGVLINQTSDISLQTSNVNVMTSWGGLARHFVCPSHC